MSSNLVQLLVVDVVVEGIALLLRTTLVKCNAGGSSVVRGGLIVGFRGVLRSVLNNKVVVGH